MDKLHRIKKIYSMSLSDEARRRLEEIAKVLNLSMSSVVELAVRKLAKEEGVE